MRKLRPNAKNSSSFHGQGVAELMTRAPDGQSLEKDQRRQKDISVSLAAEETLGQGGIPKAGSSGTQTLLYAHTFQTIQPKHNVSLFRVLAQESNWTSGLEESNNLD